MKQGEIDLFRVSLLGRVAPVDYPTDGKDYYWSENSQSWI